MSELERKEKETVVNSLLSGMDHILSSKTVVGEPIRLEGITIIPLVDVSFGLAAGNGKDTKNASASGMGGMGGKVSPNSVLVIQDGHARILSIKNQDNLTKILDMIPELTHRFTKAKGGEPTDAEVKEAAFPENGE
ncbi:MAG: GerW family sporulation protein [Lachnospiraceae bacterium]|nr:GerW family sporulation protein [Lachnospiraceae bacterium]